MIRFAIRAVVFIGSAAIGLLVAKALVDEMTIDWADVFWVVVIFAVLQSVLAPFIANTASRNAPALLGAAGLISTVVALLITSVVTGLSISGGPGPWIYASVVVWIVTMLATLLLPILLVKAGIRRRRDRDPDATSPP
ncbi:phage holin family protein [Jiangella endophytica]|uniref:phage holin family protein n=1 Tax=Jiangella endophytica TaxID=1623398 RepID=UPI000E34E9A7|nr:phage holin family protein [Jiangella endophytica]